MHTLSLKEISKLQQKYEETGVVTFPLFSTDNAYDYYRMLARDIPKEDWLFVSSLPDGKTKIKIPWLQENMLSINREWNKIEQLKSKPTIFACRYYQIPDNYNRDVFSPIHNPRVIPYIKQIISDITEIKDTIVMSLTSGCFINEHTDAGRGKAAFVYQLTDNWHPMYGGVLHFPESGIAVTPTYNTITIMKTGEKGIRHCVTPIAEYAPTIRLSVAGILY